MVTVRQLLDLISDDNMVYIINNETEETEICGYANQLIDIVPNVILDCNVTLICGDCGKDCEIAIYRDVRK